MQKVTSNHLKFSLEPNVKFPIYLRIKAIPGSNITELMEIMETENGKTYKIKLKAPPEKGKANQELIRFLSQEFKTSKEKISIISGHVSSLKLIKITH